MLGRTHARLASPLRAAPRTLGQMPETTPPSFPVGPLLVAWVSVVVTVAGIVWIVKTRRSFASPLPPPPPPPEERLA